MLRFTLQLIFLLCALLNVKLSCAQDVTYMGLGEKRDAYHSELLTEILNQTPTKQYRVNRYTKNLPHLRSFDFLEKNKEINIVIAYASEERNIKFTGVNIPILKGLNGWRTSVIHNDNIDIFKNITSLNAFKKFIPGQFHTWTDHKILLENGIASERGSNFNGLYTMLDRKRFDYFPRSILVIDQEVNVFKTIKKLNISIDPYILIKYPTAFIFYVNKKNSVLAEDLRVGFEAIIKSGKFDTLFNKYFGEFVKKIRNEKRHVITLTNPFLPKSVPLERKELWLEYTSLVN